MATIPCTTNGYKPLTSHEPLQPAHVRLPEAACSVNGYFHIQGYSDRFQATGRGFTPDEAVKNLAETMQKTRAILAPPPLATREERLARLYTSGIVRALALKDSGLVQRITKAFLLYTSGALQPTDSPVVYTVHSQTGEDTIYEVTGNRHTGYVCVCQDWTRHQEEKGYACKHSLVVMFEHRLREQEDKGEE